MLRSKRAKEDNKKVTRIAAPKIETALGNAVRFANRETTGASRIRTSAIASRVASRIRRLDRMKRSANRNLAKRKKAPSTMSRTDCSAMTTSAASNSSPKLKLLRMTIESVAPSTPKSAVTEENQTTREVRRPQSETAIPRTMRIEPL